MLRECPDVGSETREDAVGCHQRIDMVMQGFDDGEGFGRHHGWRSVDRVNEVWGGLKQCETWRGFLLSRDRCCIHWAMSALTVSIMTLRGGETKFCQEIIVITIKKKSGATILNALLQA